MMLYRFSQCLMLRHFSKTAKLSAFALQSTYVNKGFATTIHGMENMSTQENVMQKDRDLPKEDIARRILKVMNAKTYHENNKVTIRVPGFKYDDFDRSGNLNFVQCCLLAMTSRMYAFPWLQPLANGKQDGLLVVGLGNHHVVSRHLYDRAAIDYPMLLSWWPAGVGRSSIDVATALREESTGELLMANMMRVVLFDSRIQKAVPLPDDISRQAKAECSEGDCQFPAFRLDPSAVPSSGTFKADVRVHYDDTDQQSHVTQPVYMYYLRECAAQATVAGFYGRVTGDFALYTVESQTIVHTGEAFAGDELRVETWEDPNNPLQLYFVVNRRKQTICYARMLLFDRLRSNL